MQFTILLFLLDKVKVWIDGDIEGFLDQWCTEIVLSGSRPTITMPSVLAVGL